MTRNWLLPALSVALVLAAAGCGGGGGDDSAGGDRLSKDAYLAKVKTVGEKMSSTLEALGETPSDPKAASKEFEQLSTALKGGAEELAALNPPEEVDAAHDKFSEGIGMLADEIGEAGEKLKDGDAGGAFEFISGLGDSKAMKKIQEAADELEMKGYNIG